MSSQAIQFDIDYNPSMQIKLKEILSEGDEEDNSQFTSPKRGKTTIFQKNEITIQELLTDTNNEKWFEHILKNQRERGEYDDLQIDSPRGENSSPE